jgi:hypothetical protein
MRILHLTTAALMAAFVIGCSKKPNEQTHPPKLSAGTVDLGAVELVPQTPTQFSLGAGKSCTLTGKQLAGVIHLQVQVFVTNADRTVWSSPADVSTLAGRQCSVTCFNTTIEMTPKMKIQ